MSKGTKSALTYREGAKVKLLRSCTNSMHSYAKGEIGTIEGHAGLGDYYVVFPSDDRGSEGDRALINFGLLELVA